jgi:hypothetical protein
MDCEKYETSKNNAQQKYILDMLNNREIFLGPSSEILFYKTEANAEKQREFTHERVFPIFCQHARGLAIARICGLQANCWQLLALLRDSAHMASSHVRKSRKAGTWLAAMCGLPAFLLCTHTHNPGTRIRGTPVPGLGAATPGRVILTLRAAARVHACPRSAGAHARGG